MDLKHGQVAEGSVASVLMSLKVEVKNDKQALNTGNLCIEYKQDSGPSGIEVTEATWWAFKLSEEIILIIETQRLRQVYARYKSDPKNCKLTGDNGNWSVLVPIHAFLPMFQVHSPRRTDGAIAGAPLDWTDIRGA